MQRNFEAIDKPRYTGTAPGSGGEAVLRVVVPAGRAKEPPTNPRADGVPLQTLLLGVHQPGFAGRYQGEFGYIRSMISLIVGTIFLRSSIPFSNDITFG